jgi:hypothetical protein
MIAFRRLRAAGLALCATAVVAVACQTTLTLNDDNLETEIASWIEQQGGGTSTVACPDDRPIQQGDTFQCVATFPDGSTATLQVTQSDNSGNVTWQVVE